MAKKKSEEKVAEEPQNKQQNALTKQAPIRVSFAIYIISIIVVAVTVFVLMLVQYLPGYRQSRKIDDAVRNADYVKLQVLIPEKELKKKDQDMDVFLKEKEVDLTKLFKSLGVKKVDIELVESSYYEEQQNQEQLEMEEEDTAPKEEDAGKTDQDSEENGTTPEEN